jgi:hypothetical protein
MGLLGLIPVKSDSKLNDQYERSGTRSFNAGFTPDCDEVLARENLGILINYPHPSDNGMVVSEIAVTQGDVVSRWTDPLNPTDVNTGVECYYWDVQITYGPWDPLTHTATGNPVDQPVDVSFQWQVFEQAADVAMVPGSDIPGPPTFVPVVNSANDPFDPPVTREQLKGIMRVSWNSLTFDPGTFFVYGNMINNDTWNGFPPFSVKFCPPNMPQRLYSQFLGQNYYRLEGEFSFNPNDKGWNAFPIDRGYRALNGSGVPFKIVDVNGQPISQPALLNGSGAVLTTLSSYVQMEFQVYTSTVFATAFPNLKSLFS